MRPGRRPVLQVPPIPAAVRVPGLPARRKAFVRAAPAGLLAAVLLAAVLLAWGSALRATPGYVQAEVTVHGQVFRVDVADTPELQALGLGGREKLGPLEGMLFTYAQRERHTFWMRGMRIPIDMIWLDNRRVVHIEANVPAPPPGTPLEALPTYQPAAPANFVLELAAGRARAVGLKVGDRVDFRFGVR